MSGESTANHEVSRATPEIPRATENLQVELLSLKEQVKDGQFDALVDSLMGKAAEGDEVPQATLDTFVASLIPTEMDALTSFLAGKTDPRIIDLREKLAAILTEPTMTETALNALEGLSVPAQKIVTFLDTGIARLTSGGMLGGVAAKFGIKEVGPKQLEFVRNFFLGYAAKIFEGITASIRKINPGMDLSNVFNLPLELRLLSIKDPIQKEEYRKLYVKRAAETTGAFVAPTLAEAINPQTTVVQPEQSLVAGNKVEATKRTVKNADGTNMFEISRADNKTVVTADGKIAEIKIANSETVDVMALDATAIDKAGLIFKLKDTKDPIAVDGVELRDAITQKKEHFTTTDGKTIQLLTQNA